MDFIPADRSKKATLLLTIPRSIKVVCNGFIPFNIWKLAWAGPSQSLSALQDHPRNDAGTEVLFVLN